MGGIVPFAMSSEFARLDTDKNGTISRAEWVAAYGEKRAAEFETADVNQDGELSRQEYVAYIYGGQETGGISGATETGLQDWLRPSSLCEDHSCSHKLRQYQAARKADKHAQSRVTAWATRNRQMVPPCEARRPCVPHNEQLAHTANGNLHLEHNTGTSLLVDRARAFKATLPNQYSGSAVVSDANDNSWLRARYGPHACSNGQVTLAYGEYGLGSGAHPYELAARPSPAHHEPQHCDRMRVIPSADHVWRHGVYTIQHEVQDAALTRPALPPAAADPPRELDNSIRHLVPPQGTWQRNRTKWNQYEPQLGMTDQINLYC